jgi:hypothetical protein
MFERNKTKQYNRVLLLIDIEYMYTLKQQVAHIVRNCCMTSRAMSFEPDRL